MEIAKIQVTGVSAKVVYKRPVTAGMVGAQVRLSYDEPWQGLGKTVVFYGAVTRDVVTEETLVTVPAEVLAKPNVLLRVGVYGVNPGGTLAIPTQIAAVGVVREGTDPSGDPGADPALPVWVRLTEAVGDLTGLTTKQRDSLVAAVNELAADLDDLLEDRPIFITGAEYEALSEEEKAAGTYYIIDDEQLTDKTLTLRGAAADAKAVGDRLGVLEGTVGAGLTELDTMIGGE